MVEVAGYINKQDRYVAVSKRFPLDVRRFTAAISLVTLFFIRRTSSSETCPASDGTGISHRVR